MLRIKNSVGPRRHINSVLHDLRLQKRHTKGFSASTFESSDLCDARCELENVELDQLPKADWAAILCLNAVQWPPVPPRLHQCTPHWKLKKRDHCYESSDKNTEHKGIPNQEHITLKINFPSSHPLRNRPKLKTIIRVVKTEQPAEKKSVIKPLELNAPRTLQSLKSELKKKCNVLWSKSSSVPHPVVDRKLDEPQKDPTYPDSLKTQEEGSGNYLQKLYPNRLHTKSQPKNEQAAIVKQYYPNAELQEAYDTIKHSKSTTEEPKIAQAAIAKQTYPNADLLGQTSETPGKPILQHDISQPNPQLEAIDHKPGKFTPLSPLKETYPKPPLSVDPQSDLTSQQMLQYDTNQTDSQSVKQQETLKPLSTLKEAYPNMVGAPTVDPKSDLTKQQLQSTNQTYPQPLSTLNQTYPIPLLPVNRQYDANNQQILHYGTNQTYPPSLRPLSTLNQTYPQASDLKPGKYTPVYPIKQTLGTPSQNVDPQSDLTNRDILQYSTNQTYSEPATQEHSTKQSYSHSANQQETFQQIYPQSSIQQDTLQQIYPQSTQDKTLQQLSTTNQMYPKSDQMSEQYNPQASQYSANQPYPESMLLTNHYHPQSRTFEYLDYSSDQGYPKSMIVEQNIAQTYPLQSQEYNQNQNVTGYVNKDGSYKYLYGADTSKLDPLTYQHKMQEAALVKPYARVYVKPQPFNANPQPEIHNQTHPESNETQNSQTASNVDENTQSYPQSNAYQNTQNYQYGSNYNWSTQPLSWQQYYQKSVDYSGPTPLSFEHTDIQKEYKLGETSEDSDSKRVIAKLDKLEGPKSHTILAVFPVQDCKKCSEDDITDSKHIIQNKLIEGTHTEDKTDCFKDDDGTKQDIKNNIEETLTEEDHMDIESDLFLEDLDPADQDSYCNDQDVTILNIPNNKLTPMIAEKIQKGSNTIQINNEIPFTTQCHAPTLQSNPKYWNYHHSWNNLSKQKEKNEKEKYSKWSPLYLSMKREENIEKEKKDSKWTPILCVP